MEVAPFAEFVIKFVDIVRLVAIHPRALRQGEREVVEGGGVEMTSRREEELDGPLASLTSRQRHVDSGMRYRRRLNWLFESIRGR